VTLYFYLTAGLLYRHVIMHWQHTSSTDTGFICQTTYGLF